LHQIPKRAILYVVLRKIKKFIQILTIIHEQAFSVRVIEDTVNHFARETDNFAEMAEKCRTSFSQPNQSFLKVKQTNIRKQSW